MSKTYGEMIGDLVDRICKFDDRAAVMRRNDIPKGHFYNVINPNRETTSGNPFYTPIEWMVKLTRDAKDYCMLKKVAKDCDCILITPEDIKELNSTDPAAALAIIQKVIGMVK
jgi:hypothetical protein